MFIQSKIIAKLLHRKTVLSSSLFYSFFMCFFECGIYEQKGTKAVKEFFQSIKNDFAFPFFPHE